jgi:hypothetical protein
MRRAMVLTYQPAGHDQFKAPGPREAGTPAESERWEAEAR